MKILKGNFGKALFCDNMDKKYGLPSLPDKSWDLFFSDPPYNRNYKKPSGIGEKPAKKNKGKIYYSDKMTPEDYKKWCIQWFQEAKRVSNILIFTPGRPNIGMWYSIEEPYDYLTWYKRNGQSGGKGAHLARDEPILMYGKPRNKFKESVFDVYVINGFLCEFDYIHPCPKSLNFWSRIIEEYQPKSVLDIFLGSGTTAEICEKMGIPWLGYDIGYESDIEKRIQKGIEDHKYYKTKKKQTQTKLIF